MHLTPAAAENAIRTMLGGRGIEDSSDIAWSTVWLESCGYPGLALLAEALAEPVPDRAITRDALGIDTAQRSCAFLAPVIMRDVERNGRAFLRNVRHGLFLLPYTVRLNMGIGCPVDPAFAVGGERRKNPYAEKLTLAEANGLDIGDDLWTALQHSPT